MSRTNAKTLVTMSLILAMAMVMSFTGCSRSPLESVDDNSPVVLSRVSRTASGASLSPVNAYTEAQISAATGGQLTLLDVVLDVPAGAVPNDTLFSIFIPDDEKFFNEFGTDGLVFDKPVKVTMSYRGADLSNVNENTIRIGYLNENTGEWEDIECRVDHQNKVVTAWLNHFSAYGLISDGRGGE